MREIRTLRVMWRELETGSRTSPAGHEGGNPGYRQGMFYPVTAPALDPTKHCGGWQTELVTNKCLDLLQHAPRYL